MILVFLFNISYKKIKLGVYEWLLLILTAVISFSYIIALTSPLFAFMKDEILLEYLLDNLPKLGFIMTFILAAGTSDKFNIKEMSDTAVTFMPIFAVFIFVPSIMSKSVINQFDERFTIFNIDPNFFSLFISSIVPFSIYSFMKSKSALYKIISVLALGCVFYILALTGSRTGFVIFIISAVLSIVLLLDNKKRLLIIIPATAAAAIMAVIFISPVRQYFARLLESKYFSSIQKLLSGRYQLFVTSIMYYLEKPILGYGGTKEASAVLIYGYTNLTKISHNAYLDIAIQYGLLGFIAYAGLYLRLLSDFIIKIFGRGKSYEWQYPIYILFINILLAGFMLSLNFADIQIYILAFLLALPAINYKEALNGV